MRAVEAGNVSIRLQAKLPSMGQTRANHFRVLLNAVKGPLFLSYCCCGDGGDSFVPYI